MMDARVPGKPVGATQVVTLNTAPSPAAGEPPLDAVATGNAGPSNGPKTATRRGIMG